MSRRSGTVECVGTCPGGHVTRVTSAPGRVTWEGVCATDGCDARVVARRAPRQPGAQSADQPGAPAADNPGHNAADNPGHPADSTPEKPPTATQTRVTKPGARVVHVEGWADDRDDPKPAAKRAASRTRAATGRAAASAGSGAKAPGRGRRPTKRADDGKPADTGKPGKPAEPAADPGAGETAPAGRGRRVVERAKAAARRLAAVDAGDDDLFDGIY